MKDCVIRRHKISTSSMGSSNFNPEVTPANSRDRLSTPPFTQSTSSTSTSTSGPSGASIGGGSSVVAASKLHGRRKSIAVMEHRHLMSSVQCRSQDSEMAQSERNMRLSWSVVVGEADCRSVDTGLNELDRVIATDIVQQSVAAVETGSEGERGSDHLDPSHHLNLLSCYSVSCPLLAEDDESGTNSVLTSTRTSPGPDYISDSSPPPHLPPPPSSLSASVSVPEDLSETGVNLHRLRVARAPPTVSNIGSSLSPTPSPVHRSGRSNVPQVITTRYSTEDLHDNILPITGRIRNREEFDGTTEEEEDDTITVEPQILKNQMNHNKRGKEDEEEEEEDELCQSVSAPHLQPDSEDDEEEEEEGGLGVISANTRTTRNSSNKRVMFNSQEESYRNGHEMIDRSESTPADHLRKKSHRRSQSMSIVELGIQMSSSSSSVMDTGSEGDERTSRRKRSAKSHTLKPVHSPVPEISDLPSSASASRSSSMKDSRSRASSLLTDVSSLHESEDTMSEEDDAMPELSGLSCEGGDIDEMGPTSSTATPLANENEQLLLQPPQQRDSPDCGRTAGVLLRGKRSRSKLSQEQRYSADVLSAYRDEEAGPIFTDSRRLNSEFIDERNEISLGLPNDTGATPDKGETANDSVFDHDVALSDIDVRVQSDDALSQSSPLLSPAHKDKKRHSPLLGRRAHTVREGTPPTPKYKLARGLTKEDVTPVIGKMRSILINPHELSDDELTNINAQNSDKSHLELDAQSPGGGSTNLDRLPRSPISPKTNGMTPSPIQVSPSSKSPATTSPPPPSPSRQISSPPALITSTNKKLSNVPKSSSDKSVRSGKMPGSRGNKKNKGKSMSMDETSPVMKDMMSMRNAIAEPLPEELCEEEEQKTSSKKDPSKVKMIRNEFIRKSKSKIKALTILGGGPDVEKAITESYSKGSGGTGAIRAKTKQRPKLDDIFPQETSESSSPRHKVGEMEGKEENRKKRPTPPKLSLEHRRDSDSSLINSPTNTTFDHTQLSAVDETRKGVELGIELPDPNTLCPAPAENLSDSDREEVAQQLVRSMSQSHPELELQEDTNWQKTVDRRLLRKMNKNERDRQNIIHELIQTEMHHNRGLHVLNLVFKAHMEKYLSDESLAIMFPELDNLIEISRSFLDRLEERRGKGKGGGSNVIIQDISDILLEEFTSEKREQILNSFSKFCTYHLMAVEVYKEQLKKKRFLRLVQQLYQVKECQRLYLPDYYTSVSQRLTKMVQFLARLVKKTDLLKLEHADRLRLCQRELESLVVAVDQKVNERKNQMELEMIQENLEITLPRTAAKKPVLRVMGDLNLTAQNRRLIKTGEAQLIHGHGKQLPVHVVLVTDLVVLLTEKDQKYNLPAILDLKPPIIRLYDLHVRVNASVRSGVQLLLLEKGSAPEMFRLDFKSKKEAKAWEVRLTEAGDHCKENGIKCEYFGSEPMQAEEGKMAEDERASPSLSRVSRSESQRSTTSPQSPLRASVKRNNSARSTLDAANRVLSMFVSGSMFSLDSTNSPRHPRAAVPATIASRSPKNRHNTIHQSRIGDIGTTTVPPDRDGLLLTSAEIDGGSGKKGQKSKTKRKGLDRSSTFRSRGEDKKEKEKERGGGGGGVEGVDSMAHQTLLACAVRLRDGLEDLLKDNEEKEAEIERLKLELEKAKEAATAAAEDSIVTRSKLSPNNSPPMGRPHSYHVDTADITSVTQPSSSSSSAGDESSSSTAHLPPDTGT